MAEQEGKLIVLDGIDGTGKGTQIIFLAERLRREGSRVEIADFPQYGSKPAGLVEMYLNGEFGTVEEVGPYQASVLFAVDRYAASHQIKEWLAGGAIVLSNRYVAANLGHQGGKIKDTNERQKYWEWAFEFEHKLLGIPRPDKNFILHSTPEIAHELVGRKDEREYLQGKTRDIHEEDMDHLFDSYEAYIALVKAYPDDFEIIDCAPSGSMLSPEDISQLVWERVQALLKRP